MLTNALQKTSPPASARENDEGRRCSQGKEHLKFIAFVTLFLSFSLDGRGDGGDGGDDGSGGDEGPAVEAKAASCSPSSPPPPWPINKCSASTE